MVQDKHSYTTTATTTFV